MSTRNTRAIVLRRTNYGEADRILNFLTPSGHVNAIARGVRREKSKLAGSIELFATCEVVIHQGKGELGIVTSARLVQFYRHILEDYGRLQFGYEVVRLALRAGDALDTEEWFEAVQATLQALNTRQVNLELIETWFYVRYASVAGKQLNILRDVDGVKLLSEEHYSYDIDEDGLRLDPHGEVGADHIKLLRLMTTQPITVLARIAGTEATLPECLRIARHHAGV